MIDYGKLVKKIYRPIIEKYDFEFVQYDEDEMFLLGNGFGLYVFIDPRHGSNTWYVSVDKNGKIIVRTLDYIFAERLTDNDRSQVYIDNKIPQTIYNRTVADLSIACIGFLNHCNDILSGSVQWLRNYPDEGWSNLHIAKFLAPYFKKQGYFVDI